ncbi:hypothetical protein [Gracilibacillus dipsosauri]|uniref:hypothetical protein n=1 Tax=Gracilibacillus dipsosauri TaxID=178340 RepID=UPI0015E82E3B|nr:hypothetical protein [Gracilibacillus dipsosauri]
MSIGAIIVGIIICFAVFYDSDRESTSHFAVGCLLVILLVFILAISFITSISY